MVIFSKRLRAIHLYTAMIVLAISANFVYLNVSAATFTQTFLRLDRMAATTTTGGMLCAMPATAGAETKILIQFPAGFTVNATALNWTVTTTNIQAGATAWPGIGTATTVAGQTVTFPSTDLTVGVLYCFNFSGTNTLTTGVAGNSQKGYITSQTAASAVIDQTYYATSVITNDQITVTATVPPIFVFSLSGNADSFPADLDPTIVNSTTAGIFGTITTNAKGGWIAWAKDTQQGLFSASVNYKINTLGTVDGIPTTLTPGTEAYQLDVDIKVDVAGGCQIAIQAEYAGAGTNQGGTFTSPFTQIAQCSGTTPATSNGDQFTLIERATISGATPAGTDYSDIITVVAAGNF